MKSEPTERTMDQSRRSFLFIAPFGVIAGILAAAAFRLLRPFVSAPTDQWINVAQVSELQGNAPVSRKLPLEHLDGWAATIQQQSVFVLPKSNQVLSAICPHEGCEVFFEANNNRFSCPCHESYFAADGSRLQGPARRGLDTLNSRIENNTLQVQFSFFENNSAEQIKRA